MGDEVCTDDEREVVMRKKVDYEDDHYDMG
jgi:hypothetical protein